MGFENIQNAQGVPIAITGLTIVFAALIMISGFIALLPRVMDLLATVFPEDHPSHAAPSKSKPDATDEALVAAIGFALHQRRKPPT